MDINENKKEEKEAEGGEIEELEEEAEKEMGYRQWGKGLGVSNRKVSMEKLTDNGRTIN